MNLISSTILVTDTSVNPDLVPKSEFGPIKHYTAKTGTTRPRFTRVWTFNTPANREAFVNAVNQGRFR